MKQRLIASAMKDISLSLLRGIFLSSDRVKVATRPRNNMLATFTRSFKQTRPKNAQGFSCRKARLCHIYYVYNLVHFTALLSGSKQYQTMKCKSMNVFCQQAILSSVEFSSRILNINNGQHEKSLKEIEDISWPRGDMSERSERVKYFFNKRREISNLQATM